MIKEKMYREIIKKIPTICVDIIIKDEFSRYLLAKRTNNPLRGEWWVVGGRINMGESCLKAAIRKIREELGITLTNLEYVGYYEDQFDNNAFDSNVLYHTISMVFGVTINRSQLFNLDSQHSEYAWFNDLPARFKVNVA
jgi:colanic acid biosynthesis protein WcaH